MTQPNTIGDPFHSLPLETLIAFPHVHCSNKCTLLARNIGLLNQGLYWLSVQQVQ